MLRQLALTEMTPPPMPTSLPLDVGTKLRARRLAKRMTLADIAEALATTPQTVQRLETANQTLSLDWLQKYCAVLEIDPGELFGTDDLLSAKTAELAELRRRLRARARTLHAEVSNFVADLQAFLDQTEDE